VTTHEVTYRGPSSFAVQAAALIADSAGIELTSANRADGPDTTADSAVLVLVLEGTDDAVAAGLDAVRAELPAGATLG
jgi:hypothetical protein